MTLNILISTIDQGITKVGNILRPSQPDIKYFVSHQYRDKKFKVVPEQLNRPDVVVSQIPGAGLSRNRNNAIRLADGYIAIIADDDVTYLPDSFQNIAEVFKNDPELDVACFKIRTPENEAAYKNYPTQSYRLKKRKHHPISSIEIAFRIKSIRGKGILFDERFGLGSPFLPAGEESVFIDDCIAKGLKLVYFPYFTVEHSLDNAIRSLPSYDKTRSLLRSGVDAHINPILAIPRAFGRTLKYLPEMIRNKKNPFNFLFNGLYAIFYIWFTKRNN
jgi:glycosyltransferase involved in cell wall biosynthesis